MIHTTTSAGKFRRLVRKLRSLLPPDMPVSVEMVATGILERLWHVAISSAPRGDIGRFDDEEIAEMIGWHGDATALVNLLAEEHWLDKSDEHRLLVHDWHEHAPRHVKANVKKLGGFYSGPSERKAAPCASVDAQGDALCMPSERKEATPNLTKPNLTKPSPPTPPPAASGGDGVRSQAWKGVEEDLLKCGVGLATKVVGSMVANHCTPDDAINVIAYWRCCQPAWDAGALYTRLANLRPGQDHTELWPERSAASKRIADRESTSHRAMDLTAKRVAAEQQKAADDAQKQKLEQEFGGAVDAMPREELVAFIREHLPTEAEFMIGRLRGTGPPTGVVREALLGYLDSAAKRPMVMT